MVTELKLLVGIGASAGGLEALEQFFRNVPEKTGMAFVVVQHLSPDYKSMMVELISKHTKIPVFKIEDNTEVESDTIYILPPKKNVILFNNKLLLEPLPEQHGLNLPIDIFLRSLAEEMEDKAVGIILSGTGSDGTLGIRAIKGKGGLALSQDLESSKFDGMPRNASNTGLIDYILPPWEMPGMLLQLLNHLEAPQVTNKTDIDESQGVFNKILLQIREFSGVDFRFYKESTINRRVERRVGLNQCSYMEDYYIFLKASKDEQRTLYQELLIGVTDFFRDKDAFEQLRSEVILPLIHKTPQEGVIRVWTIGCSTGEEAYSLAMLFIEEMTRLNISREVKIFATDIDQRSIEYASSGLYPENVIADLGEDRINRFFKRVDGQLCVNETVRHMVVFARHDILTDPPFSKIDLITCRNLLIYIKADIQKKLLNLFQFSLNGNGYLFLGNSESLGNLETHFTIINSKWKLYQLKKQITSGFLPASFRVNKQKSLSIPQHMEFATQKVKRNVHHQILEKIIQTLAPDALILDEEFNLIHVTGNANRFLSISSGVVTFNISDILSKELSLVITSGLNKLRKKEESVVFTNFEYTSDSKLFFLDITLRILSKNGGNPLYAVIFNEKTETVQADAKNTFTLEEVRTQRIEELGQELQISRENHQAAIEELEASNEELQATNEELIASNEELQSTNEELQSVNEELHTVNTEYQKRIDELTVLTNDYNNVLAQTSMGMVFLDLELTIRKYTGAATEVFHLMEHDIGRPFKHITHQLKDPLLHSKLDDLLETLVPNRFECQREDGVWYEIVIVPYREANRSVTGVVVTSLNTHERKKREHAVANEAALLRRVLDHSPMAQVMLDNNGLIVYANRIAVELLKLTQDDINSKLYNSPDWNERTLEGKPIKDEDLPYNKIMTTGDPVKGYCSSIFSGKDKKEIWISGSPMYDLENTVCGAVFSIVDLSLWPALKP